MAHFNIGIYKTLLVAASVFAAPIELEKLNETNGVLNDAGRNDTETLNQSTEESLQSGGSDTGALLGESGGGTGADTEQTNTDNDVAGPLTDETQAKPKNRTK